MTVAEARRQLGSAAIVSESEAVDLLPVRDVIARDWLRARNLVREVPGLGKVVYWGDVVDEIRLGSGPVEQAEPARAKLPRAGIKPRVGRR